MSRSFNIRNIPCGDSISIKISIHDSKVDVLVLKHICPYQLNYLKNKFIFMGQLASNHKLMGNKFFQKWFLEAKQTCESRGRSPPQMLGESVFTCECRLICAVMSSGANPCIAV